MFRLVAIGSYIALVVAIVVATQFIVPTSTITSADSPVEITAAQEITPSPSITVTTAPTTQPSTTPKTNLVTLVTKTPTPQAKPKVTPFADPLPILNPDTIFADINNYRIGQGKAKLEKSNELCGFASARAAYLVANNMAAFNSSENGQHTGLHTQTQGYSGKGIGENLTAQVTSDTETISNWKASPAHRDLLIATEIDGVPITKGCVTAKVESWGSIVVFLAGDK